MQFAEFDTTAHVRRRSWQISDFRIVRELGTGRFGRVFEARERSADYTVALKVLRKAELGRSGCQKEVFREVNIQRMLKHPDILRLIGFFHDEASIVLILEFAAGG
jgi:serine/threonine protein kinase